MNPLENARTDLAALMQQREALDQKIKALNDAIKILETVYRPNVRALTFEELNFGMENLGLTDAVERVLMELPNLPFPPTRVRDTLVSRGVKITGDNPMASIHQVLKRLVARVDGPFVSEEANGQTTYRYDPAKDIDRHAVGRHRSGGTLPQVPEGGPYPRISPRGAALLPTPKTPAPSSGKK